MTHMIVIGIPFMAGLAGVSQPAVGAATVAKMPPIASRRLIGAVVGFVGCIRGSMPVA